MRVTSPPLNEKQKAHLRRLNGVKTRWAQDTAQPAIKKTRDFLSATKADWKPRAFGGRKVGMSEAKRAMVALRDGKRAAFFASLGGSLGT